MSVEARTNQIKKQYFFGGDVKYKDNEKVVGFGSGGRNTDGDMVKFTVMARNITDLGDNDTIGALVPLTSLVATDGTSIPVGLLAVTLSEAELEAVATTACIDDVPMFIKADSANEDEVVFDGASPTITLDSVVSVPMAHTGLAIADHAGPLAHTITTQSTAHTSINKTIRQLLQDIGICFHKANDASNYEEDEA